jgi:hypothetical protein
MVRNSDYFYAFVILSLMPKLTVILFFPLTGAQMVIHFLLAPWMVRLPTFTLKRRSLDTG